MSARKVDLTYQHHFGTFTGKVWRALKEKDVEAFKTRNNGFGFRAVVYTAKGMFGVEKTGYKTEGHAISAGKQCNVKGSEADKALRNAGL